MSSERSSRSSRKQLRLVQSADDEAPKPTKQETVKSADEPDVWTMPLHPVVEEYPKATPTEQAWLVASIRRVGLKYSGLAWQGQLVDGRHRREACREAGVSFKVIDKTADWPDEATMRLHVAAANEAWRSRTTKLTAEERKALDEVIAANPTASVRQIAEDTGVSRETVRKAKAKAGDNAVTLGRDGKTYRAKKSRHERKGDPMVARPRPSSHRGPHPPGER